MTRKCYHAMRKCADFWDDLKQASKNAVSTVKSIPGTASRAFDAAAEFSRGIPGTNALADYLYPLNEGHRESAPQGSKQDLMWAASQGIIPRAFVTGNNVTLPKATMDRIALVAYAARRSQITPEKAQEVVRAAVERANIERREAAKLEPDSPEHIQSIQDFEAQRAEERRANREFQGVEKRLNRTLEEDWIRAVTDAELNNQLSELEREQALKEEMAQMDYEAIDEEEELRKAGQLARKAEAEEAALKKKHGGFSPMKGVGKDSGGYVAYNDRGRIALKYGDGTIKYMPKGSFGKAEKNFPHLPMEGDKRGSGGITSYPANKDYHWWYDKEKGDWDLGRNLNLKKIAPGVFVPKRDIEKALPYAFTLGGGALGAGVGALAAGKGNRLVGGLLGGGLGAGAGYLAHQLAKKYNYV